MRVIWLDGGRMETPKDFYGQFFYATRGVVPDLGGSDNWNLDGLNDDLRELAEPITVVVLNSPAASRSLGEWFERCIATLIERDPDNKPVQVFLEALASLDGRETEKVCIRCKRAVERNAQMYETYEAMHWACFHYEYEHDGDPDVACGDPSCPARAFDSNPPPTWEEDPPVPDEKS